MSAQSVVPPSPAAPKDALNIAMVGCGYVGLVTGACLAELGHTVVCLDSDAARIGALQHGEIPIYEPGLDVVVQRSLAAGRMRFTGNTAEAMSLAEVVFIAVGTPQSADGSAELRYVFDAAHEIALSLIRDVLIVDKSTVPVGTASRVRAIVSETLSKRAFAARTAVVSNPEFLREGSAIADFMRPERVVVGVDAPDRNFALPVLRRLYATLCPSQCELMVMDTRSAELTKYAANAMLATRISFINELANLADATGADIEAVRQGIGSDSRIGPKFLQAGIGYGGSCFPKDVQALLHTARMSGVPCTLVEAVQAANERQKHVLINKLRQFTHGRLAGLRVAVWGLAFKPNTDDMREAPSLTILPSLLEAGVHIAVFDPVAQGVAHGLLGDHPNLLWASSALDALVSADVLMLLTEWPEFAKPDWANVAEKLAKRAVFDGRNLFDAQAVRAAGLAYFGIGRGQ